MAEKKPRGFMLLKTCFISRWLRRSQGWSLWAGLPATSISTWTRWIHSYGYLFKTTLTKSTHFHQAILNALEFFDSDIRSLRWSWPWEWKSSICCWIYLNFTNKHVNCTRHMCTRVYQKKTLFSTQKSTTHNASAWGFSLKVSKRIFDFDNV